MQIKFLGTGGYHPNERRHTACILLPELGLAFDAGTAAFRLQQHVTRDDLSIFLSHAHWDHIIGLSYLLIPMASGQLKRVTVYGTERTLDAVKKILFATPTFPVRPTFKFRKLTPGRRVNLKKGVTLSHWPQPSHPGGTTGFRLAWTCGDGENSLCYVTDTSVDGSYTDCIRETDLLIHECYFPDGKADWAELTGHSTLRDVLGLAEAAAVKRLMLVHLDPQFRRDEELGLKRNSQRKFPVQIAQDLQVIDV